MDGRNKWNPTMILPTPERRLLVPASDVEVGDFIPCVGEVHTVTPDHDDVTLFVKFATRPSYTLPSDLELWITRFGGA